MKNVLKSLLVLSIISTGANAQTLEDVGIAMKQELKTAAIEKKNEVQKAAENKMNEKKEEVLTKANQYQESKTAATKASVSNGYNKAKEVAKNLDANLGSSVLTQPAYDTSKAATNEKLKKERALLNAKKAELKKKTANKTINSAEAQKANAEIKKSEARIKALEAQLK